MSARDPVVAILAGLNQPVSPRAEFAESLLAHLLEELGEGRTRAGRPLRLGFRLPRILPQAPPRQRIALVVIALLLLLAGIATATYFGVRTWVSAGPRGVQYSSDFRLARVFSNKPPRTGFWPAFALGPSGRDIYALSQPPTQGVERRAELVRIPNVATTQVPVTAQHVLSLDDLKQPRLWDPGIELGHAIVGQYYGRHFSGEGSPQSLAVAENGDVFVSAGVWPKRDAQDFTAPPVSAAVIVRHADGSLQKVVTVRELVDEALSHANPDDVDLDIAASDPGLVWVKAHAVETPLNAGFGKVSVIQVRDPNGDGDWSDHVIRRLAIPPAVPLADRAPQGWTRTYVLQIVAEPSVVGGPPSILLTTLDHEGEFRIYRIEDRNGDGDALDDGEATRVFAAHPGFGDFGPPQIVPRVVIEDGKIAIHELVAASLSLPTRLTRISESGTVTDFGRSFEQLEHVLAASDGRIYAVVQTPGFGNSPPGWAIYRFQPVKESEERDPPKTVVTAAAAGTRAGEQPVPRLAFAIESSDLETRGRIVTLRADGRGGVRTLVRGVHNHGFCQSANGRRMAYFSDQEAPHELFIYVANADGTHPQKVTEKQVGFWCRFGQRWFLLTEQTGAAMTLVRHELSTGKETELVRNVDRLALSPNGNTILYVGGLDFSAGTPPNGKETLELIDMNTLTHRRLDGPLAQGGYGGLQWSPDGQRVAYFTGPSRYPQPGPAPGPKAERYAVYVRAASGGPAQLAIRLVGGPPSIAWSPNGRNLVVCAELLQSDPYGESGCSGGAPDPKYSGKLYLVDLVRRSSRVVAKGKLLFAGWAPSGGSFAYATDRVAFLRSIAGRTRRLARAPVPNWPVGEWIGFSPDGRYVGLGNFSSRLGVIDTTTGRVRILLREKNDYFSYPKWWR